MFDTPCVSTPRRSVMVSTSAPSAASSGLTPSFSKICVTVRRNAASGTRTMSFAGTLKRSRIMPHSFVEEMCKAMRSHAVEQLRPLLQHLGMPVADHDAEMAEPGRGERADPLPQLVPRCREGGGADQLGRAHLVLLRPEEHEVAAVIGEIARIGRLVAAIDLAIALEQWVEFGRQGAAEVAEGLALDQAVERDGGRRPRLGPRARAIAGLALVE